MARSPLATRSVSTSKRSSREGAKVTRLIIHHTAGGTNEGNVKLLSESNGYQVSAHYVLQTTGKLVSIVPEEYRAWTTGRAADLPSVTVETVNSAGKPDWKVTDAQLEALSQLAADLSKRYGWGKLTRSNVRMHREFMATACPGPYIAARIDKIIARANEIRGGKTAGQAGKHSVAPYDDGDLVITAWPQAIYRLKAGDRQEKVAAFAGMTPEEFWELNGVNTRKGFGKWPVGLRVKVDLTRAPLQYQLMECGKTGDGRYTRTVAQTQRRLRAAFPSYAGDLKIDGIFGPALETVVKEHQDRANLPVTGVINWGTWKSIHGYA